MTSPKFSTSLEQGGPPLTPAAASTPSKTQRLPAEARSRRRPSAHRRSTPLTIVMLAVLAYFLLPLFWLLVASTKSTQDLFNSFGLWFSDAPQLLSNVKATFTQDDGVFGRWLLNTVLYAGVSAVGAALLAAAAGYGFAKYRFRGHGAAFNLVLGAIMIPTTALAIPTYLLFAKAELVNTPWAVILPSLVSPFGLYLMRIYAEDAVPDSLIEAARMDGAGELRIFLTIALRLLAPGLVTVVLFTLVATWNNYFLPLIMLNDPNLYPITVGLSSWAAQAHNGGAGASSDMLALVVTGSLISIVPLVLAFLMLQRYWQSGLATGGVKQ
ncbi:carbohydrate ABC transporter permease [Streptomyces sp. NPDC048275]|uniref:carbohydrate ABC transporter permease n=1 Tax=Streptomyces sp. NPDC048275 TaxID=3155629 RepID=UPI0033E2E6E8